MPIVSKTFFALGLAATTAVAINNSGLADCGGFFLLHTSDKQFSVRHCGVEDTLTIRNLQVHGGFRHIAFQGRYTDHWDIKGKNKLNMGNAGFESSFKYMTLGVDVYSLPFIKSSLTVHHQDSQFYLGTAIARGKIPIGNIRWISENKDDIVHEISVDWESHVLYRSLTGGGYLGKHHLEISGAYLKTTPENPDQERYIRDSINVFLLSGKYGTSLGKNRLQATYTYANANAALFGIFHQDESRKRFMYIPLEGQLHLWNALWQREKWQADLTGFILTGEMNANKDRFYETLAPNRVLPSSILKSLSFSFLQKNFRIEADLDAWGIIGGFQRHWKWGHRYALVPRVHLDTYYAAGNLDIEQDTETSILLSYSSVTENYRRELKSAGGIANLGIELKKEGPVSIALDYSVTQLLPLYLSYREIRPDEHAEAESSSEGSSGKSSGKGSNKDTGTSSHKKTSGDVETKMAGAFRNGFATHLGISVRF